MKTASRIFMALMLLAVCARSSFAAHQITAWPDNKNGAVSVTFDDSCPSHLSLGIPALNERGLKGTFFLVTANVGGSRPGWDSWSSAAIQGHEIGSHTISHPNLQSIDYSQIQNELGGSKSEIDAQITSQKTVSLSYPWGSSDDTVRNIAQNIYIAARGTLCDLNIAPFDFFNVRACSPDVGDDIYGLANAAEQQQSWLVVYIHTLDAGKDGCWGDGNIAAWTAYLDNLKARNLWVGTFGAAVKYIKERTSATLSVSSSSSDQIVLNLTDTLDDATYNQPLTLRSEVPSGWAKVSVQQGNATIEVNSAVEGTARVVYYNALPNRGSIYLRNPNSINPQITLLAPNGVASGGASFTLTVSGSNFVSGAKVRWNGFDRTTTFSTATQLRATIPASDIAAPGSFPVSVLNPNGGISNAVNFEVKAPAPVVADLSPSVATNGGAAFTLTVLGSNFISGAKVRWNGFDRTTTFSSATQLRATIPASDIAAPGSFPVTVLNPDGGLSNSMAFAVWGPAPILTSLMPSYTTAGGSTFILNVSGSNFISGAKVRWNGFDRTTTFSSATQLRATIPASDIAAPGSFPVTVLNPDGGLSNSMAFAVLGPAPTVSSLSPSSATAGGTAFTLTVNGSGFVSGSVVRWNGSDRTTTYVSSTRLRAAIAASDIAVAGTAQITVYTQASGGVTSNARVFTIKSPPVPTISSLSPSARTAGGNNFTLTVYGSGFVSGSVVRWNGSDRTTTYVSSTRLRAAIAASDIAVAGRAQVTVYTSAPGGGVSNARSFTIR